MNIFKRSVIFIKLIIKPRGMGKTYDLIYWAHKTGIPIVTAYNKEYLEDMCKKLGYTDVIIFSLKETLNHKHKGLSKYIREIYVDEVDEVCKYRQGIMTYKFCPNCSAEMLKDDEEVVCNGNLFKAT